jgi:RNA polymerase sigma-70 factor (ECF subfamily)
MNSEHAIQCWLNQHDQSAAQWLVEAHRPLVHRVVSGRLSLPRLVEDVVQETFIRAFKALHRFVPVQSFEAWLCTIARNAAANAQRNQRRNPIQPATDCGLDNLDHLLVCCEARADDDLPHAITTLLAQLTPNDRRMWQLVYLEGLSSKEVAQHLGISEGNVRVRITRTRTALRTTARTMRAEGLID